jgi:hypothetical protein
MLRDESIPAAIRAALEAEKPAFLLGNIAADARNSGALKREDTHFYSYDKGIYERPWRVMLQTHPSLLSPSNAAQRTFLAGYVAHLTIDEVWSADMLGPHFVQRDWGDRSLRFLMLHIILAHMDERDYRQLEDWQHPALEKAQPNHWTPFMSDAVLQEWRDFIAGQIAPEGTSQTLSVFGGRINKAPEELRAILDSPEQMQRDLWDNITPETLAGVESTMYRRACEELRVFWEEMGG